MLPVILSLFSSFGLIALIIVFIMLYRLFYPDVVKSQIVAFVLVAIITFLLLIPYPWITLVLFAFLFMYSFFWTFKPYKW